MSADKQVLLRRAGAYCCLVEAYRVIRDLAGGVDQDLRRECSNPEGSDSVPILFCVQVFR